MDVNWHLHDQTPNVSGGLHGSHTGGWVTIETRRECLTVFSEDLPALAAVFAAASRRALDLARSDMAKKSEPLTPALSNVSEALVTAGQGDLLGGAVPVTQVQRVGMGIAGTRERS